MRRIAIALLTASLLLAGCGDDDEAGGGGGERERPADQKAATGTEISGGGNFTVRLPNGWKDGKGEADLGSVKPEIVVVGPSKESFATNVNVVREPAPKGASLDEAASAFRQQVQGLGARNIRTIDAPQLGGEEAQGHEFERTQGALEIVQRQVYAIHGEWLYTATFSVAKQAAPEQGEAFGAILASWRWAD